MPGIPTPLKLLLGRVSQFSTTEVFDFLAQLIDDASTAADRVWSAAKLSSAMNDKLNRTGPDTFTGVLTANGAVSIDNALPYIRFNETDTLEIFYIYGDSNQLRIGPVNNDVNQDYLRITNTGRFVSLANLASDYGQLFYNLVDHTVDIGHGPLVRVNTTDKNSSYVLRAQSSTDGSSYSDAVTIKGDGTSYFAGQTTVDGSLYVGEEGWFEPKKASYYGVYVQSLPASQDGHGIYTTVRCADDDSGFLLRLRRNDGAANADRFTVRGQGNVYAEGDIDSKGYVKGVLYHKDNYLDIFPFSSSYGTGVSARMYYDGNNKKLYMFGRDHNGAANEAITLNLGAESNLEADGNFTVLGTANTDYVFDSGGTKRALELTGPWCRINDDNSFTSGIYCGTSILRTDGEFQVGNSGSSFKVTSSGNATLAGDLQVKQTAYFDAEYANSSGTSINWNNGNKQSKTYSGTSGFSLTFTDPPGPTNLVLKIITTNSLSGSGITYPSNVKWPGGNKPTGINGNPGTHILAFYFDGTNYYGTAMVDCA